MHELLHFSWTEEPWVKMLIRGISNHSNKTKKLRRAATVDVLRLIKTKLIASSFKLRKKRLLWLAITLLFCGCLRGCEILCPAAREFSATETLLSSDVTLSTQTIGSSQHEVLTLILKNTKETRTPTKSKIELVASRSFFCAVDAYKKFSRDVGLPGPNQPLLQLDGQGLTSERLNLDLKTLLAGVMDDISTHSFRSGYVSSIARAGASDEIIQIAGRWSSEAYRLYMKTNRINRLRDQQLLVSQLSSLAKTWSPGSIMFRE